MWKIRIFLTEIANEKSNDQLKIKKSLKLNIGK